MCVHIYSNQKDKLGHEKAAAQVLVDGGPGALDLAEEPESEDAHEETNDGDHHTQLGDAGQHIIVSCELKKTINTH